MAKFTKEELKRANFKMSKAHKKLFIDALRSGDYERTVEVLMSSDSDPVITRKPNGAWSHAIWDAM